MLGIIGWSPRDFWTSTPYECSCAYVGYCKANQTGLWATPDPKEPDGKGMVEMLKRLKAKIPSPKLCRKAARKRGLIK